MITTRSRAFGSPFRYIQGPDELDHLAAHAAPYGRRIFLLLDPVLLDDPDLKLEARLAGLDPTLARFSGECTEAEVARVEALAKDHRADIIAGLGGGKTLDTAKMAAARLGTALFIIPSSASTDAPTSAMSVLYTEEGAHLRSVLHQRGADLVLVDSRLIARAPLRLFVAGLGDALSTWFEARANARSDTANYIGSGYRRCQAGLALARHCYEILLADGLRAKLALASGAVTEAVENVIEANILLSGLGFENAGCAAAHALPTGLHEIPALNRFYHGELVAFGVVFQLVLENAPQAELTEVLDFLTEVDLPVSLGQLGLEPTPANFQVITRRVLDGRSGMEAEPFLVTEDLVIAALLAADALGRRHLEIQAR